MVIIETFAAGCVPRHRPTIKQLAIRIEIEDPTVWTRPWTIKQEFTRQSEEANQIYYEPRCIEGNYALPGLMRGARMQERAFAEGRGPDPATRDSATPINGDEDDPWATPLQ
jgi:hypothetical protein